MKLLHILLAVPFYCGRMSGDDHVVGEDKGEYWRCTAIEPETRLRVGRAIGQTETQAAIQL